MRVVPVLLSAVLLLAGGCDPAPAPMPAPAPSQPPGAAVPHRVVGYFTSWGVYGRNFQVRDVKAAKLTHLVYAFGKIDHGECRAGDPWADYRRPIAATDSVDGVADGPDAPLRGNFGQLRRLKAAHPGLRVLWSFGGWTGSRGFTLAARDPDRFAASCRELLADPRWAGVFDGIDIDWEYPNACGLACDASGPDALPALLRALRGRFGPAAPVTAAVPADPDKLRAGGYAAAARSASWLSAMTYDFFGTGATAGPTAPHSPLRPYPGIPRATATTDAVISELLSLGVPPDRLLLGIGFYGRGWTGVSAAAPGGTATGPAPGSFEKGIEDYAVLRETCPPTGTVGGTAYALCRGQWWGYDTPATVGAKMRYARSRGLAGAFAWELSGDTADGQLIDAMATGLRS
jgi:chitinase